MLLLFNVYHCDADGGEIEFIIIMIMVNINISMKISNQYESQIQVQQILKLIVIQLKKYKN